MNIVLDVLRLRRVRLDYVSPPICQVILSGSGSSFFTEAAENPDAPFNLALLGQCERFLVWNNQADVICTSLYRADNPSDPLTKYTLIADCMPQGSVSVCSEGWWQYSTLTPDGVESDRSTPVAVPANSRVIIPIVKPPGAVRFNLFRNPDLNNPTATFGLVLSTVNPGAFEVCELTGCYRLQVISEDGASELSAPICHSTYAGCIPGTLTSLTCPSGVSCIAQLYSDQLEVVGGTSPYLWEILDGAPPAGVTIHTGLFIGTTAPIDGTPTEAGDFPFTIRCTSSDGALLERDCTIQILGITEYGTALTATTDTAYSYALTPAGGTAPYTYALTAGALPTGMSLSAAGVISGTTNYPETASFSVTITDSLGVSCEVPLSLEVTGCPSVNTYPTIADWDAAHQTRYFSGLDRNRRILWVSTSERHNAALVFPPYPQPYQIMSLIDTVTNTFIGFATDTLGLINSTNKGDLSNGMGHVVIDTKYDQCVVGGLQTNAAFYDLATKDVTAWYSIPILGGYGNSFLYLQMPYDPVRGYIYMPTSTGNTIALQILDCTPGAQAVIASHLGAGWLGGEAAFSTVNDTLYLANTDGGNLYHKWDPTSALFTYNVGPATGSTTTSVRYIRELNILMATTADNKTWFVDPLTDTMLGQVAGGGATVGLAATEYDDCSDKIYFNVRSGNNGIQSADPNNGYAVGVVKANNDFNSFSFDKYANRLYAVNFTNSTVETYA